MARIDNASRRYVRTDPDFPLNATIDNDGDNPIPVSGPLTDAQLRAADVKITLDGEKITSDQLPSALGSNGGLKAEVLGVAAVSGSASVGSAPTAPPLSVAGTDPGGLKRHLATDTGGKLLQKPGGQTALGYQQLTSLSAASALTVPTDSVSALIQAETKDVRWRDDGTNPTASVGMIIPAGTSLFFTGSLSAFRVIETAASAKLNVSYYG